MYGIPQESWYPEMPFVGISYKPRRQSLLGEDWLVTTIGYPSGVQRIVRIDNQAETIHLAAERLGEPPISDSTLFLSNTVNPPRRVVSPSERPKRHFSRETLL